MHPFYGPNSRLLGQKENWRAGIVSMSMYLIFWAAAIGVAIQSMKKYFIRLEISKVKTDSAMAILRERYAKGEMEQKEYLHKKADLENGS